MLSLAELRQGPSTNHLIVKEFSWIQVTMTSQTLVRNDTGPKLTHTCKDSAGNIVDVSGSTVSFHMQEVSGDVDGSPLKVDSAGAVDDGPNGVVSYTWTAADTDASGWFRGEFELTGDGSGDIPNGEIRTFPVNSKITIRIVGDVA